MNIIIDLILLLIVALCIWDGYKRGLIGGIAGIFAIIIALLAGSSLSDSYASEAVPVLKPFIDGYIDSQKTRSTVLELMGYGSTDLSLARTSISPTTTRSGRRPRPAATPSTRVSAARSLTTER